MTKYFKAFMYTIVFVSGCMVYGINDAEAHVYVCKCTDIVDFCYWEDNH